MAALNILEEEKVGCLENEDLYDDLDKEDIRKLKSADLIREIYIKEKKLNQLSLFYFLKIILKIRQIRQEWNRKQMIF